MVFAVIDEMPPKQPNNTVKKRNQPTHANRKRASFPNDKIVSLHLGKCFGDSLLDLMTKLNLTRKPGKQNVTMKQSKIISKFIQHGEESARQIPVDPLEKEGSGIHANLSSSTKTAQKFTSVKTGKRFKSLGKRFIKEFVYFAKLGDKRSIGSTISLPKTLRWLKKAKVIDYNRISIPDVEIHFINALKTERELKIVEFIKFLTTLCNDRGLHMSTMITKLLKCREQNKDISENCSTFGRNLQHGYKSKSVVKKKILIKNEIEENGGTEENAKELSRQLNANQDSKRLLNYWEEGLKTKISNDTNVKYSQEISRESMPTSSDFLSIDRPNFRSCGIKALKAEAYKSLMERKTTVKKNIPTLKSIHSNTTGVSIKKLTSLVEDIPTLNSIHSNTTGVTIKKPTSLAEEIKSMNTYRNIKVPKERIFTQINNQYNKCTAPPINIEKINIVKQERTLKFRNLKPEAIGNKIKKEEKTEFLNSEKPSNPLFEKNSIDHSIETSNNTFQKHFTETHKYQINNKILSNQKVAKVSKPVTKNIKKGRENIQGKFGIHQSNKITKVDTTFSTKVETARSCSNSKPSTTATRMKRITVLTNKNLNTNANNIKKYSTNKFCENLQPNISKNNTERANNVNEKVPPKTSKPNISKSKKITIKSKIFYNTEQRNIGTHQANYHANRTVFTQTLKETVKKEVKCKKIKRKKKKLPNITRKNIDASQTINSPGENLDLQERSNCIKQEEIQVNTDVEVPDVELVYGEPSPYIKEDIVSMQSINYVKEGEIHDNIEMEILETMSVLQDSKPLTIKKKKKKNVARTFTNLSVRYVERCLQKSQNLKINNNLTEKSSIKSPCKKCKTKQKRKEEVAASNTFVKSKQSEILSGTVTNNLRVSNHSCERTEFGNSIDSGTSTASAQTESKKKPSKKTKKKGEKVRKIRKVKPKVPKTAIQNEES